MNQTAYRVFLAVLWIALGSSCALSVMTHARITPLETYDDAVIYELLVYRTFEAIDFAFVMFTVLIILYIGMVRIHVDRRG